MMKRVDIRAILRAPILRAEVKARCWGDRVGELSLVPLGEERLGRIGLDEWLCRSQTQA